MTLYFKDSFGKKIQIGMPETMEEAMKIVQAFLEKYHYKSHYIRVWGHDHEKHIDVGSWSEEFILEKADA